jgi:hypothetical protein
MGWRRGWRIRGENGVGWRMLGGKSLGERTFWMMGWGLVRLRKCGEEGDLWLVEMMERVKVQVKRRRYIASTLEMFKLS